MIETVTVEFSPAFYALPYAVPIMLQMLGWLNESFNCTQFKLVDRNADVYIFMDSEGKRDCGRLKYGEYGGCYRYPNHIDLQERLFTKDPKDWKYAYQYRRAFLVHEFGHYFTPYLVHSGLEQSAYRKNRC